MAILKQWNERDKLIWKQEAYENSKTLIETD